jgi:hypothetical protein
MIGTDPEETATALDHAGEFTAADLLRDLGSTKDRLEDENAHLKKVIAHLMTNSLNTWEVICRDSDIDSQTGEVEIVRARKGRTTVRVIEPAGTNG